MLKDIHTFLLGLCDSMSTLSQSHNTFLHELGAPSSASIRNRYSQSHTDNLKKKTVVIVCL